MPILTCPLWVPVGKRRIYLNLGVYRNLHYQTSNKAKAKFKEIMMPQILRLPKYDQIEISYTLFPGTSRICDVSNICSIIDKYLSDAIVELGKLPDDNYKHLVETRYRMGFVDRNHGRVEACISIVEPPF